MPAFDRLHPHLRHAIVHDLGWRGLRPVQELTIEAVLDGCNTVVLAPTAGGKTEASLFPVLSRILDEDLRPVSALYVCPIRALLNNQEERIQRYARMVGLEAFKWHGDVNANAKARFRHQPAHILMITPESLEVMLISEKTDARALFASLSIVVVDEIHAFAGDDRGGHLVSVLERLAKFCGRDLQRIGLSATVGNPDTIGAWLQGSSARPYRRVDPPRGPAARDLRVELFDDAIAVAAEAARMGRGRKSLVFVETRSEAERIAGAMSGQGVEVFVHHSAVSRADRKLAEERFTNGENTSIVCTSTMELGIDVGDLDQVLQVDAPTTVASLLQRMGRTGRRDGTRANCTFLCRKPEAMLQATALLRLVERGFIEDVRPVHAAAHLLAHQILALTLQEGGLSRYQVLDWVARAAPFAALGQPDVEALVDTMIERRILFEGDARLSLGAEGERIYGKKHFFELYAVFSSPAVLRVEHARTEVGTISASFLQDGEPKDGPQCFRLGGRAWLVAHVDWKKGVCEVVPAERGKVPSWVGAPLGLSFEVCQEEKRTLADDSTHAWLGPVAAAQLAELRENYAGLVEPGDAPFEATENEVVWHTFAGMNTNRLLAHGLHEATGRKCVPGNTSIRVKSSSAGELAAAAEKLRAADWAGIAAGAAGSGQLTDVSKFQRCLPDALAKKLLVERLFDVARAGELMRRWGFLVAAPTAGDSVDQPSTV